MLFKCAIYFWNFFGFLICTSLYTVICYDFDLMEKSRLRQTSESISLFQDMLIGRQHSLTFRIEDVEKISPLKQLPGYFEISKLELIAKLIFIIIILPFVQDMQSVVYFVHRMCSYKFLHKSPGLILSNPTILCMIIYHHHTFD